MVGVGVATAVTWVLVVGIVPAVVGPLEAGVGPLEAGVGPVGDCVGPVGAGVEALGAGARPLAAVTVRSAAGALSLAVVEPVPATTALLLVGVEIVLTVVFEVVRVPPPSSAPPVRPTSRAPTVSATTSNVDSFRIIDPSTLDSVRQRRVAKGL
jgi:hypothetical protein